MKSMGLVGESVYLWMKMKRVELGLRFCDSPMSCEAAARVKPKARLMDLLTTHVSRTLTILLESINYLV